jgi:hypothetical protein
MFDMGSVLELSIGKADCSGEENSSAVAAHCTLASNAELPRFRHLPILPTGR